MRPKKSWVYSPPKPPKPSIPASLKLRAQAEADALLDTLRPELIAPPPEAPRFNYITALQSKWHRGYLYLSATYAYARPSVESPSFDAPFARLEYTGGERFNLAYMRHTGKWWEVYQGILLEEAIAAIREGAPFQP